jgi:hypothetical protein
LALRLGVDLDGVVADFRRAFQALARRVLHHRVSAATDPETVTLTQKELDQVWRALARTHNWWTTLEPYEPDQIARLYALAREHRWEVAFLTKRPPSAGDSVQFQTQWWLEQHGYPLPAVVTVPGSRGELANALRLDVVVDDQLINCVEIVSSSTTKSVLLLRKGEPPSIRDHATARGIGVVSTLEDAIVVLERLNTVIPRRRGRLSRLSEWFTAVPEGGPQLVPKSIRPKLSIGSDAEDQPDRTASSEDKGRR